MFLMNYVCPKCGQKNKLSAKDQASGFTVIDFQEDVLPYDHKIGLQYRSEVCPSCDQVHLAVSLNKVHSKDDTDTLGAELNSWQLLPDSVAKKQPGYIPRNVINDYNEACLILEQSPRAAAVFARRSLQRMIRNFHDIKGESLAEEISMLEGVVSADQWQALKGLVGKGNIGKHMSQDVNQIIEIDDGEAERLIAVLEYLFDAWYVQRKESQDKLKKLQADAGLRKR
jgi:hypothetical protein